MDPADFTPLLERGKVLHRQGRLGEAMSLYQQVLATDPENADAFHLLGVIANQRGEYGKAAALIGEAVKRSPTAEHFHNNLGLALMGLADWVGAHAAFIAELSLYPSNSAGHANLGALFQKKGQTTEAIYHFRAALAQQPADITILNNLGFAYVTLRAFDSAWEVAQQSLQVEENPDAFNVLGLASRHQGKAKEALGYFTRALKLKPDAAEVYLNMGVAYRDLVEYDRALAAYDRALQLKPDYAEAHLSRALILLARAEFKKGWQEYEYGLLCGERSPCSHNYPVWRGEALQSKTILVCAEQGLGDEIMFASILSEIIEQARHCVLECDAKLVKLYARSFPHVTLIPRRKAAEVDSMQRLPPIDFQSPIGSLPQYRRRRLEDFPRHKGYLNADPDRVAYWKAKLDQLGPGLKVGIGWRGGTPKTDLERRSIPLVDWLPILEREDILFVSLQYTDCREELEELKREYGIVVRHWREAIDDYDETAALVCALDLVLTVQTAVFHLSGALGRPVWGLLRTPAEWRYMAEGHSVPWYPSARLFRQRAPGNWAEVMRLVAADLSEFAKAMRGKINGVV